MIHRTLGSRCGPHGAKYLVVTVACTLALVSLGGARADVIPPDEDCPSGQVWVRGHSGGCREEAPTDCPAGWRGVTGGACVVDVALDGQCRKGLVATSAMLCLEKRLDHGNGRVYYDPPHEVQVPVGIVGAGGGGPNAMCTGTDRHAETGQLCVAANETAFAYVNASNDARGPRLPAAAKGGCSRGCEGGEAPLDLAVPVLVLAGWARRRAAGNAQP